MKYMILFSVFLDEKYCFKVSLYEFGLLISYLRFKNWNALFRKVFLACFSNYLRRARLSGCGRYLCGHSCACYQDLISH